MTDLRKKINLFNQHFAYVNKRLFDTLCQEKGVTDISTYIKRKAKQQFHISVKSPQDVDKLVEEIKENMYDSPSDWLREKIRNDLRMGSYRYYLDEMLCLDDVQTEEDIKKVNELGFKQVRFTATQFKKRFPLLDTSKVFFNQTILHQTVYYDKEKYAVREISCGYIAGKEHTIDNFTILVAPDFDEPVEKSILLAIDFIYEALQEEKYEYFAYLNMPLYVNEILDELIRKTDDKALKARLRKCKE